MVRLLLAKEDTEVLEIMTSTQGRNADHECEAREEELVKCNCQSSIPARSLGLMKRTNQMHSIVDYRTMAMSRVI